MIELGFTSSFRIGEMHAVILDKTRSFDSFLKDLRNKFPDKFQLQPKEIDQNIDQQEKQVPSLFVPHNKEEAFIEDLQQEGDMFINTLIVTYSTLVSDTEAERDKFATFVAEKRLVLTKEIKSIDESLNKVIDEVREDFSSILYDQLQDSDFMAAIDTAIENMEAIL